MIKNLRLWHVYKGVELHLASLTAFTIINRPYILICAMRLSILGALATLRLTVVISATATTTATSSAFIANTTCNPSTLNTTTYLYPITQENATTFDIARATNRGVCDINRQNLVADVTVTPNVGQQLIIPPETCSPDNDPCLLPGISKIARTCINSGPRLYYAVNSDTYARIAQTSKYHGCIADGYCTRGPGGGWQRGVGTGKVRASQMSVLYKDLTQKIGTTVGQIMMLSPTYNYSSQAFLKGGKFPLVNVLVNCSRGANVTALD
ncbi:uncharacterized protein BDV17DRAFT_293118 [Aspergillus undulatus]|uniref:uncharacterized protein n=1 Tax=Aspergillus undulatus TaxID=1810928 RepID=UPI003CCD0A47